MAPPSSPVLLALPSDLPFSLFCMTEHMDHPRLYRLDESLPLHIEIRDAMQETIERATVQRGVQLLLTGGISASLLSRDAWPAEQRPLSRDLDFLVSGEASVRTELEEEYEGSFVLNTGKAIFKSNKLQSHSANGVELDFIASSNIVHDDTTISVGVSSLALRHAQREEFLGVEVSTLPSELVVIQKLFAGRGIDLGKYDLLDAESIIRSGRVDPALLRAFVLDLSNDDSHHQAIVARLSGALSRLSPDVETRILVQALHDKPSSMEIDGGQNAVRDDISKLKDLL